MKFTTSWDDGYAADLRIADVLDAHGAKGTFYVCPHPQHNQTMLTEQEIQKLSLRHEIGAHTIHHPKLARIELHEARKEIAESKAWVEKITGKPCTMFCYPYGSENSAVRKAVEEAGFLGARTIELLKFSATDAYGLPTSIQLYPFPLRQKWTRMTDLLNPSPTLRMHWTCLRSMNLPLMKMRSWLPMVKHVFTHAVEKQEPFFHLWGHANEIEKYRMWGQLEEFLAFVHTFGNAVEHVPNSALLSVVDGGGNAQRA